MPLCTSEAHSFVKVEFPQSSWLVNNLIRVIFAHARDQPQTYRAEQGSTQNSEYFIFRCNCNN